MNREDIRLCSQSLKELKALLMQKNTEQIFWQKKRTAIVFI